MMPGARRGMTFLEVICGSAILSIVAAAAFSVFSFVSLSQIREQRHLACMEVANRLMLSYLDNPTSMPDANKVVEYGPAEKPLKFRFECKEEPIRLVEVGAERRGESRSPLRLDRFKVVRVRVWLSEQSGGGRFADAGVPQATITRMMDPIALRNPDSLANMMSDDRARQRYLEQLVGLSSATAANVAGAMGGVGNGGRAGQSSGGRRDARTSFDRSRGRGGRARPSSWGYEQWGGPGSGMVDPY
jgi:prepilin-type N-terminal cleavage/methylation domain-containing protein